MCVKDKIKPFLIDESSLKVSSTDGQNTFKINLQVANVVGSTSIYCAFITALGKPWWVSFVNILARVWR